MPPAAKHPAARSRRNKSATAAELVPRSGPVEIPALPERWIILEEKDENGNKVERRVEGEWHPQAIQTWTEVWSSEMVDEWLEADFGLIRNLLMVEHELAERFERGKPIAQAVAETAKARKELGLTPMGRRSLDWVIAQTNESQARTRRTNIRRLSDVDATAEEEIPEATVVAEEAHQDELGSLYG